MKQKFIRGDIVHIAKDLGSSMDHFDNDKDAIIIGSYDDQFGGGDIDDYTVMFCESGCECSWYREHQLTLIRHAGEMEIHRIKDAKAERDAQYSNIDWILSNWTKIRKRVPGATMSKLMSMIGIDNPWGRNGEGFNYYRNSHTTFSFFDKVLSTGDESQLNELLLKFKEFCNSQPQNRS